VRNQIFRDMPIFPKRFLSIIYMQGNISKL